MKCPVKLLTFTILVPEDLQFQSEVVDSVQLFKAPSNHRSFVQNLGHKQGKLHVLSLHAFYSFHLFILFHHIHAISNECSS